MCANVFCPVRCGLLFKRCFVALSVFIVLTRPLSPGSGWDSAHHRESQCAPCRCQAMYRGVPNEHRWSLAFSYFHTRTVSEV